MSCPSQGTFSNKLLCLKILEPFEGNLVAYAVKYIGVYECNSKKKVINILVEFSIL